jgi:hypothetical protein
VKCSLCEKVLGRYGFCITLVSASGKLYTSTLHAQCVESLIGVGNRRKLDRLCLDSGWSQAQLPGFDTENAPPGLHWDHSAP